MRPFLYLSGADRAGGGINADALTAAALATEQSGLSGLAAVVT